MELSSFVGQMSALKTKLLSVLPKVTDVETYLSNMDQIFIILTLIKLGTGFDNIWEQILTGSTIPTFDDIFAQLLCHSSTVTRSRPSEDSNETSVMLAPSHPRGDSQSICGGYRGRGQRPHCTYCNRTGHIQDRCYQLHGRPPHTTHVAQSSDPLIEDQPPSPSQGVTLTPGEYEEFLRLTHAAKSASIASVAQTGNASSYLAHSLGPWILGFGASDHLFGNKDLLFSYYHFTLTYDYFG